MRCVSGARQSITPCIRNTKALSLSIYLSLFPSLSLSLSPSLPLSLPIPPPPPSHIHIHTQEAGTAASEASWRGSDSGRPDSRPGDEADGMGVVDDLVRARTRGGEGGGGGGDLVRARAWFSASGFVFSELYPCARPCVQTFAHAHENGRKSRGLSILWAQAHVHPYHWFSILLPALRGVGP